MQGAKAAGRFAGVLEIQNGLYPAFADCSIGSRPAENFMYYLNRRYGFGFSKWDNIDTAGTLSKNCTGLLFTFPTSAAACEPVKSTKPRLGERTWFPDAGVLICRPHTNSLSKLAVAIKGGHNAEHHNHNDVTTYLVVNDNEALLVDPGPEVYTHRTFSSKRYESKVLNSFGHPVPVVAGKLQSTGVKAHGEIIKTSFSDDEDRIVFDIKSAYKVPELESLHRIFRYCRKGTGSFSVTDRVAFNSPQTFETALITLSCWKQKDANTLFFRDLDEGVKVVIETEDGGFELEELGWSISDDATSIEKKITASGKSALRINDKSKENGSNITSARINVTPGEQLTLSGKHYSLKGSGVGVYVRYYNKENKLLNKVSSGGNISALLVLQAKDSMVWGNFSKPFTPPPETEYIRLWIHSMNGAEVDAVIDDLAVKR